MAYLHSNYQRDVDAAPYCCRFSPHRSYLVVGDRIEREYEKRGLEPDPIALAAVNEVNPTLADEHPNGAPWRGEDGAWNYIACHMANGGRYVYVHPSIIPWYGGWLFAGRRKDPSLAFTPDAPSVVARQPRGRDSNRASSGLSCPLWSRFRSVPRRVIGRFGSERHGNRSAVSKPAFAVTICAASLMARQDVWEWLDRISPSTRRLLPA